MTRSANSQLFDQRLPVSAPTHPRPRDRLQGHCAERVPLSLCIFLLLLPIQKDGTTSVYPHPRSLVYDDTMHADPTYPLLPVFAFLGFVVGLIPLPWHLQASNAGTCVYMIWASFACLIQFINSIAWRNTALSIAPVWCDICESSRVVLSFSMELTVCAIATKFIIGAGVGIPASTLCINRRLYKITSVRCVSVTPEEVRLCPCRDCTTH